MYIYIYIIDIYIYIIVFKRIYIYILLYIITLAPSLVQTTFQLVEQHLAQGPQAHDHDLNGSTQIGPSSAPTRGVYLAPGGQTGHFFACQVSGSAGFIMTFYPLMVLHFQTCILQCEKGEKYEVQAMPPHSQYCFWESSDR